MKNKVLLLLRMPDWFFAAFFFVAFPIYKALHQKKAYGRTVQHLCNAKAYMASQGSLTEELKKCSARDIFKGIFWNAIDSYRGLAHFSCVTNKIVFENENILKDAMHNSKSPEGIPSPLAAISIHQGAFELLHRSLCQFSDNIHLITDSVGNIKTRQMLKVLRSDKNLTEYHPDELHHLLHNLFAPPKDLGKKDNAILAMVIDQGKNTKGKEITLFGQASTLFLRLPEKLNQMGVGIITFRTFTRFVPTGRHFFHKKEIVIRFETFYPPRFNDSRNHYVIQKNSDTDLTTCIAKEVESWISEHPSEWSWNYHGNFRTLT